MKTVKEENRVNEVMLLKSITT